MQMLRVRKVTKSDSESLLALLEEGRNYKLSLGDNAWGDFPFDKADVQLRLLNGNCFIAEVNGVIAGSIMLIWDDEHNWGKLGKDSSAGYIHGLVVSNKFRGQKLGKQIIDWAINEARTKDRSFIRLDCGANNIKLCKYYENLGFIRSGTKNNIAFYQRTI